MKTQIKGDELVITIPLKGEGTPSKSGKMNLLAQTGGWQSVPGCEDVRFNVMVGRNNAKPQQ